MEDNRYLGQAVSSGMLGYPLGGCPVNRGFHDRWTAAPTLVRVLVDIAMITGEIAPRVDLEHELGERRVLWPGKHS